MKNIAFILIVLILIPVRVASAATRDLLAHSCNDWSWFAHITKVPNVVPTEEPGSNEQTECFALQNAAGHQWRALPVVPGRAVALAARSSQLVMLLANGQWLSLWADGSATGQPLPADGVMKTLSDDGEHLWSIGSVSGGIDAANKALVRDAAATRPSTMAYEPIVPPLVQNAIRIIRNVPSKMVLFKEENGRWATVAELPADAQMTDSPELSLTVIAGEPLVSFKTDADKVRTMQYTSGHVWKDVGWITNNGPVENFSILSDGFKPLLWCTGGNAPGELYPDPSPHAPSLDLPWTSPGALDGIPTAVFKGGYVCVFGPHAGQVYEQRYKPDAIPVGVAAEVNVISDLNDSPLPRWLEVVFLTAMGFSAGASVFQRVSETPKSRVKPPVAAPILLRLSAGLLDALPILGAVFYIGVKSDGLNDMSKVPLLAMGIILGSAAVVYVLHTTLTEVFTGRTAGKWAFGLKVVKMDGSPASRSQLLIRNLLRVIDPLIMIIISPQGQRSADAVAGTMVVPLHPLPEPADDPLDLD